MLSKKRREEYDQMAVNVAGGKAGYKPAKKSPYSKSPARDYGSQQFQ